jgi:hypothetical protein
MEHDSHEVTKSFYPEGRNQYFTRFFSVDLNMALVPRGAVPPCTGFPSLSNEDVFVNYKEHILRIMYNLYVLCSSSTLCGMDVTRDVVEVADKLFHISYLSAAWDEREFMTSYLRQAIIDNEKNTPWSADGYRAVSDYKQYICISRGTIELLKFVQDVIGRGIALVSLQWFLSENSQETVKLTPECSACFYTCNIIDDTAYLTNVWLCDTCVERTQMMRLSTETRECSRSPGLEGDIRFAFDSSLARAKTELVYAWTDEPSLLVDQLFTYYVQNELSVPYDSGMTAVNNDIGILDTAEATISFMVLLTSQSNRPSSILFMCAMFKWNESVSSKCEFGRTCGAKDPPVESTVIGLIIVAVSCQVDANRWRQTAISMGIEPMRIIIPLDMHHVTHILEQATQRDVRVVDPIFIILRYDQITRSIALSFNQYTFLGIIIGESGPDVGSHNNLIALNNSNSMKYRNLISLLSLNPLSVRNRQPNTYHASLCAVSGYTEPLEYEYQRLALRSPLSLPAVPTMYPSVNINVDPVHVADLEDKNQWNMAH